MRIALDATYSVGKNLSGVGVYSNEIIRGVADAQPDWKLVCSYRPHRFLRSFRQQLPSNCQRRILWESHRLGAIDVFHGLNQRLPSVRYRRTVTTFHDLFVLTGEYSTKEFRQRFAEQAREAAQRSDLIIAVSKFTAGQVEDLLGVESSRIRVVPHGVRLPRTLSHERRERVVLFLGAIQRRKNVVRIIEAFERLPCGWKLVLAGSTGFGSEEILDRISGSPCRNRIVLPGYVSPQGLEDLFSRARIFAFPSLDEGFGIPVLEAMARGVPVITSDRSALPEVAGSAALCVDPTSVDAIADAMLRLSAEGSEWVEWARCGYERAAECGWERSAAATASVYKELVSSPGQPA